MNRFFSKLDLRDIKIDPAGSSFPPDGETFVDEDGQVESAVFENSLPPDDRAPVFTEPEIEEPVYAPPVSTPVETTDVLKVSAKSRPSAVAGAIAGVVRETGHAEVQAIGAGATNQAVKAVAIARDYLRESGIDAVCLPSFIDVTIDSEDRTAILLVVEAR